MTPVGGTFISNNTIKLHTPANLAFGNGSDGWAIFSDPDGIHFWEVWEGSYNSVTMTYQAKYMVEGDYVNGTGWGQNGLGAGIRAAGASVLGGIVTQDELNNLSIHHALSIELDVSQLKAGATPSDQLVFPAVSTDSGSQLSYTGTIPMGAHFALPPSLDLSHAGLTPEGLALAEAYQTYGGYVVDSAGHTTSLAQIEGGTTQQYNDIFADLSWIRDHLVMTSPPPVPTVIESFGSTSLVEVGNNFYLDSNSGGSGPELKQGGAAVVAGQFGAWTPIGVEQTATKYEVAWKVTGADQYSVWSTDGSGNYLGTTAVLSGASATLESYETSFHQDLNGDGIIGIVTAVAAGAMVELAGASNAAVKFVGATGTLILDQSTAFSGQINNFTGNGNLSGSDQLDLKDITFAAGVSDSYTGNSSGGVLTVSDAQNHVAHIALSGNYTGSTFSLSSDGHGGTIVIDPVVSDLASGKLSFAEAQSSDSYSVEVSPENENSAYLGNFTVDAPNVSNGQVSAGWHFNLDEPTINQEVTQSYQVSLVDEQHQGISQAVSQTVSVTIGGPGNDSFIFHPGVGTDIVANAKSTVTIELDGFSSIANSHELATLLQEAQTGISQSVFSSTNDGHDTTINLGNHDSITLAHIQLADLHANNFIIG
jgi:hypothetical protein